MYKFLSVTNNMVILLVCRQEVDIRGPKVMSYSHLTLGSIFVSLIYR
jgi:hypothetical protein